MQALFLAFFNFIFLSALSNRQKLPMYFLYQAGRMKLCLEKVNVYYFIPEKT